MKRREFVKNLGLATAGLGLTACGKEETAAPAVHTGKTKTYRWKMVTSWPPNYPMFGTTAQLLADTIGDLSNQQLTVKVYGASELVPAFEAFDAVADNTAEMSHSASYYWKGKVPAAQPFSAVPFGMNANSKLAWLYHGEGLALWREVYQPHGVIPFPSGQLGLQMGGWFNKEIRTVDDIKGLKMRIPGLGGEVLRQAGGTPVGLPGSELFTALETGTIDATEWASPYNDVAFGLHKAAKHYYFPGWHEPDTTFETLVNQSSFDQLPEHLQKVVEQACFTATQHMRTEYTKRNAETLVLLKEQHKIIPKRFPKDFLDRLHEVSQDVLNDIAANDAGFARVLRSYQSFQKQAAGWQAISEQAYYDF